jgi:exodeoxyribonuclease-5
VAITDRDLHTDDLRDAEADAVADLCARLIDSRMIVDRKTGQERACQPGDIALLAPTGAQLWRYEEALERRGVPVATQAGKGLFRRQEIQDLIALTRVLADRRDRLALGALLRGPLVGLTEEELLDIVWALPRPAQDPPSGASAPDNIEPSAGADAPPDRMARLDLSVDPACIAHPLARDVIARLQSLARRANATTPLQLLSQAVDMMRVRPILRERHGGQAERALANVDLYLSLSARYGVRGLRAFAEAITAAWSDETRAVEGRPDAQEEAVALFTIHAAKGLEWPIVIPVNTMTSIAKPDAAIIDRQTGLFHCPVLDAWPEGYAAAHEAERLELGRERIRLWYVAATRARDLLILPRLSVALRSNAWLRIVELDLDGLPGLGSSDLPADFAPAGAGAANRQTRDSFAQEAAAIATAQPRLAWLAPSRDETTAPAAPRQEDAALWVGSADAEPPEAAPDEAPAGAPQGGRDRGLILHKLIEEVLTGETDDTPAALADRAGDLIRALGRPAVGDAATGLSAQELADCVARTLRLPEIADLRPGLLAEVPVYAARHADGLETAMAGIADALTPGPDGRPVVVVDWKSDVKPDARTLDHYRSQVSAYLDMTGASRGLIVLMTEGRVISVAPAPAAPSSGPSPPAPGEG